MPKYICQYCDKHFHHYTKSPKCPKCLDSNVKRVPEYENGNIFGYPEEDEEAIQDAYNEAYLSGD